MSRVLDSEELTRQLVDLPKWSLSGDVIEQTVELPDFPTAIVCVDRVAVDAEAMNHHPDIDIRWRKVTFRLSTHSEGGITQLDIELAHQIDAIAASLT